MVKREIDKELFKKAKKYIPGGVNSPVRAFKAVDGDPLFVKRGKGSKIYGENGKRYIDYCLSWGALILGHAHPQVIMAIEKAARNGTSFGAATKLEIELARLVVEAIPSIEQVRLTNSGSEAVLSALRLALAYTGRKKIIKFEGGYHGAGMPDDLSASTVVLPYNNLKGLEEKIKGAAAVLVEPVAGNMGVILPKPGFLRGIRKLCDRHNVILIFDEVITGFRVSFGGAQKLFGIEPDLTCLGKIIGGGLPAGAFGGRKKIMQLVSPQGSFFQAGTFSGNPLTVSAGLATLRFLQKQNPYAELAEKTRDLCENMILSAKKHKIAISINYIASMFSLFFTQEETTDYRSARSQNRNLFKRFFHAILNEGIYFSPSGMEANFFSLAHTSGDVVKTQKVIDKAFMNLGRA